MGAPRGHRRLLVVRGTRPRTAQRALAAIADVDRVELLWVSSEDRVETEVTPPAAVRGLLGRSFRAAVLDLHDGLDPDLLGQVQGFVWGGGCLVLRMPDKGAEPVGLDERLAIEPYGLEDVGHRLWRRLESSLETAGAVDGDEHDSPPNVSSLADDFRRDGPGTEWAPVTDDQAQVVSELGRVFASAEPSLVTVLADRGRGKSSALGLAVRQARAQGRDVVVTGPSRDAAAEVFRFADRAAAAEVPFVTALELGSEGSQADIVVVDEAAQLPVPVLQRLVRRHRGATIVFASTVRGYEGTGRGFVLRFVRWLRSDGRALHELSMTEPIRWSSGDPVERFVFDVLALDAEPAASDVVSGETEAVEHRALSADELAADETLLREVFGLLVHAHYRTTPADLHRLLDAPNLRVHALMLPGKGDRRHVVATTLLAMEGGLPAERCDEIALGRARIRGHALPDTLISHAGQRAAGELHIVRSVRIATHPGLRRRGLATRLVEEVHRAWGPSADGAGVDLFGTLFGATPELLRFRRSVGYELVRVGASRGTRTGEPAAVMLRACSTSATELLARLRADLARELPLQLELLERDGALLLDDELRGSLLRDLPPPRAVDAEEREAIVRTYAFGPRPFESVATVLTDWVEAHAGELPALDDRARRLVAARVLERRSWLDVAALSGCETVPTAMRGLRRAFRALLEPEDDHPL